jgi:hypothetical protein
MSISAADGPDDEVDPENWRESGQGSGRSGNDRQLQEDVPPHWG